MTFSITPRTASYGNFEGKPSPPSSEERTGNDAADVTNDRCHGKPPPSPRVNTYMYRSHRWAWWVSCRLMPLPAMATTENKQRKQGVGVVDKQLAANLAREWRERIKTEVRPEYQTTETVIKEALRIIRSQIKIIEGKRSSFQEKRNDVTATFTDFIKDDHHVLEVIKSGLEEMEPPSFQDYLKLFADPRTVVDDAKPDSPPPSPTTPPQTPAVASRPPEPSCPTTANTEANRAPQTQASTSTGPEKTAKRVRPPVDLTEQALKKSKLTSPTVTKNADIDARDVDGREYIFAYQMPEHPPLARGCESRNPRANPCCISSSNPVEFRGSSSPSLDHYNNPRTCKGHDASRMYAKTEDIVRSHGHRVVGSMVNEAWVKQANTRLAERSAGGTMTRVNNRH
ncbi:hypothetical protein B0T19DRAFT_403150 [Cercophora scortea]|uniref:Uncharacterized protein n=1 Tax=Cercophora scortea TaxID=314031 RepID=A0AAE0I8L6_9PEZI|nr:hypothetical protein B0T19DRAFT_403150 [Cercophora scortea]